MVPTNVLLDELQTLLATDTATLADASALKVLLISAPFNATKTLAIGDVTEATFDGYAAKSPGTGAQQSFVDPATGMRVIQLLEPAGGWHWACSGNTGLPQSVYGYVVTDNAKAVVYGSAVFGSPIVITASGQAVDVSQLRFTFVGIPLT